MTRQSEYESRIERLRVVVSAYGGDPSRWPAQDRDELLDLVDTNPEAMAIVRDGQQFDQLLDVAKSLHPCPKWRYMRIQQFNAQIIVSNRDLILVHSQ